MAKTPTKEPTKAPSDEKINRRLIYGRRQGHRLHKKQARLVADLLPQVSPDLARICAAAGWFDKTNY